LRIQLPDGEEVTSLALSSRYIVATTSKNYTRVWTLFGTPVSIWRMKSAPAVACSAHGDYVMTVANGAVGADGCTQLVYSIEDIRHSETHQNEDLLCLGISEPKPNGEEEQATLKNIFWSDAGDPCIYDSAGVLLTLLHWRNSGQAKWVPLLDTTQLERLKSGKKEETYWPVAVAGDKFHAIILKGGETSPYFPRPLLSEFDFNMPVVRPIEKSIEDDEGAETNAAAGARLEESFMRNALLYSLLEDQVLAQGELASHSDKTELRRREIEIDKVLLQLLAVECREGEDRGMKALEVVKLLRDKTGKMVEAASKVAGRWGLTVLEDKIRTWAESRLQGMDED
jgi:chromosome transmission fidelity protein 4